MRGDAELNEGELLLIVGRVAKKEDFDEVDDDDRNEGRLDLIGDGARWIGACRGD